MGGPCLQVISINEIKKSIYEPVDAQSLEDVKEILHDIRSMGEEALVKHAVRLGDLESIKSTYIVGRNEMENAYNSLSQDNQEMFQRVANRIETFAKEQKNTIQEMEIDIPGGKAGQNVSPLNVAGCYAPGGRYPLPSSVLMTTITARVAGVKTVIVASPRPSMATLAAAYIAKADMFVCIGGAQAIAAMAYGIGSIPECDIIVGPGNKWVTAAKSVIFGKCAIDMLAGPSECLVIADDTSSPKIIAADLLAQAEHDTAAIPILVTTSENLISRVNAELHSQLATLPTRDVATCSLQNGFAILCNSLDECISASDKIGPEHLEIMTENSNEISKRVKCYGALFIGKNSAEVFGDYGIGPNHVLPTGTTSRYTGGLSVFTFLRIRSWMRIDNSTASIIQDTAAFARIEGLEGHARAAEKRLQ